MLVFSLIIICFLYLFLSARYKYTSHRVHGEAQDARLLSELA